MRLSTRATRVTLVILTAILLPNIVVADDYPMKLEIVSPEVPKLKGKKADREPLNIEMGSGWPLTFKLTGPGYETLAVSSAFNHQRVQYPELGTTGFMVLEDPDGCPVLGPTYKDGDFCAINKFPDPLGLEEVWVEFTPDIDFPGVLDKHGHNQAIMENPTFPPQFGFGPLLADDDVKDGIGWVRNDDLPQLVLLSDIGIGLSLTDPVLIDSPIGPDHVVPPDCPASDGSNCVVPFDPGSWVPKTPLQARNLAGLLPQVGYELNSQKLRTTITTSVMVPRHMFWPNVIYDSKTSFANELGCATEETIRVDGGPVVCGKYFEIQDLDKDGRFEIRAFLLKEYAPETWDDCDGDGTPAAADAWCNGGGYTLLSNEVVLRIAHIPEFGDCYSVKSPWGENPFWRGVNRRAVLVSFDGSNDVVFLVCPGGGGGTSNPPREF